MPGTSINPSRRQRPGRRNRAIVGTANARSETSKKSEGESDVNERETSHGGLHPNAINQPPGRATVRPRCHHSTRRYITHEPLKASHVCMQTTTTHTPCCRVDGLLCPHRSLTGIEVCLPTARHYVACVGGEQKNKNTKTQSTKTQNTHTHTHTHTHEK